MPGPLKGPGKFWNIDPIWGYILLILATQIVHFNFHYTFNLTTFLTPPFTAENFLVPPFGNSKLFLPPLHFAQPPRDLASDMSTRLFQRAIVI